MVVAKEAQKIEAGFQPPHVGGKTREPNRAAPRFERGDELGRLLSALDQMLRATAGIIGAIKTLVAAGPSLQPQSESAPVGNDTAPIGNAPPAALITKGKRRRLRRKRAQKAREQATRPTAGDFAQEKEGVAEPAHALSLPQSPRGAKDRAWSRIVSTAYVPAFAPATTALAEPKAPVERIQSSKRKAIVEVKRRDVDAPLGVAMQRGRNQAPMMMTFESDEDSEDESAARARAPKQHNIMDFVKKGKPRR